MPRSSPSWSVRHSPPICELALKIWSTGTLNHLSMFRLTNAKAKRKRQVAGISVSVTSDTRTVVLNFEPGFCCFRSVQTLISVRSKMNPKIKRTRKTNADSVTSRRIWFGSEGLKNGSRLNAACAKTIKASISRNSPAAYSFVVCDGTFIVERLRLSHGKTRKLRIARITGSQESAGYAHDGFRNISC